MYNNGDYDRGRVERPKSEPEIIPPDRGDRPPPNAWGGFERSARIHRIYIARPGPFSIFFALLITGLAVAAILLVLLGAVLLWVPVVIFVIAAFMLSGTIRHYWRRLQHWASGRGR